MYSFASLARWVAFALADCVLLLLLPIGCSDDGPTKPIQVEPSSRELVVVTTDYESGSIAIADADSSYSVRSDVAAIHSDALACSHNGLIYVINRLGEDNIQVLDPEQGFQTVRQFSVGPGTNPQGIAFATETQAYVSRSSSASLLEVDPSDGSIQDEVSLAALADGDGIPDMGKMFYRDPYLYIAIQRIDFGSGSYLPVPPSYLAVLDTRDNALIDVDPDADGVQGIVLRGVNPIAAMVWDEGSSHLLVACVGKYGLLDGGIDQIDLEARESVGWLVTEQEIGGDMIGFAITDGDRGYATVSDEAFNTSLVAFDRASGTSLDTVYASDGYELAGLLVTPWDHVIVCDRDYENPGLRIFEAGTGKAASGIPQPLSTGLPPFEIIMLEP